MGLVVLVALLGLMTRSAEAPQPHSGDIERGTLPANWITGASCPETPQFRIHEYNSDFFILRQSACTNFEKPFLYLIFGQRSALLVDTGAANADVAGAIRDATARWSAAHDGRSLPLIVAHSHGHGDHIAGDAQLKDRPHTTVVAATPEALQSFFGFRDCRPTSSRTTSAIGRSISSPSPAISRRPSPSTIAARAFCSRATRSTPAASTCGTQRHSRAACSGSWTSRAARPWRTSSARTSRTRARRTWTIPKAPFINPTSTRSSSDARISSN
jgi:hypothetical protein